MFWHWWNECREVRMNDIDIILGKLVVLQDTYYLLKISLIENTTV